MAFKMRSIISISIFISVFYLPASLSKSVSEDYDPFVAGPFAVNHTSYLSPLTLFLDTNLDVYAPNATGAFPVFYFITGFGGTFQKMSAPLDGQRSDLLILSSRNYPVRGLHQVSDSNSVTRYRCSWSMAT
jgi:hypothetical protein